MGPRCRYWPWALLMRLTLGLPVDTCPHCGGRTASIASAGNPVDAPRVLRHPPVGRIPARSHGESVATPWVFKTPIGSPSDGPDCLSQLELEPGPRNGRCRWRRHLGKLGRQSCIRWRLGHRRHDIVRRRGRQPTHRGHEIVRRRGRQPTYGGHDIVRRRGRQPTHGGHDIVRRFGRQSCIRWRLGHGWHAGLRGRGWQPRFHQHMWISGRAQGRPVDEDELASGLQLFSSCRGG